MNRRYLFGVLGVITALLLLLVFVLNRGGNDTPTSTADKPALTKLVDYADKNSIVSMTIVGKLVGEEEHRSIRIVVTPTERSLQVLSGYEQNIISAQTYPNTKAAYENFLSALGGQGFLSYKKSPITDQRSTCPTGNRYVYDVTLDGQSVSNLWNVNCDKSGTFAGKGATIRQLFERQIPEYNKQITGIKL
jgi:hypothetical protein